MGIFDGVLICSDWDGSLSRGHDYPGREVCPENREAIKRFQENGGLFTVSSGRYPSYILAFREQFFPNTALIALNGSLIVDPDSGKVYLGSIVICRQRAKEQASEYGHSLERELAYLTVHGVLHLLSFDHIEESDKRVMREAEERILGALGIGRE